MFAKNLVPLSICTLILIIFIGMFANIQYLKSQRDKARLEATVLVSQIETQNAAVDQWKKESELYEKKFREAEKKSRLIVENYNKKLSDIDNEKISLSCEDSIKWGIKKAGEI